MIARWFVTGFGVVVLWIGAWAVIDPRALEQFAEPFLTPTGLWMAVALRLAIGLLMIMAAAGSRLPTTLRVLGALIFLSGLALPVVGLDRMVSIATWGAAQSDLTLRLVGLVVAALGGFVIWTVQAPKDEA